MAAKCPDCGDALCRGWHLTQNGFCGCAGCPQCRRGPFCVNCAEVKAVHDCPHCGVNYPDGNAGKFCDECGNDILAARYRAAKCLNCGQVASRGGRCCICNATLFCNACRQPAGTDRYCDYCGEEAQVSEPRLLQVPYTVTNSDGKKCQILGSRVGYLVVETPTGDLVSMPPKNAVPFLKRFGIFSSQVPPMPSKKKSSRRTETVSLNEWEMFLRFKQSLPNLKDCATTVLEGWLQHTRELGEEDEDEESETVEAIRRIPRHLIFIEMGHFPLMEDDDSELANYCVEELPSREEPRKTVVRVRIVEIAHSL